MASIAGKPGAAGPPPTTPLRKSVGTRGEMPIAPVVPALASFSPSDDCCSASSSPISDKLAYEDILLNDTLASLSPADTLLPALPLPASLLACSSSITFLMLSKWNAEGSLGSKLPSTPTISTSSSFPGGRLFNDTETHPPPPASLRRSMQLWPG